MHSAMLNGATKVHIVTNSQKYAECCRTDLRFGGNTFMAESQLEMPCMTALAQR